MDNEGIGLLRNYNRKKKIDNRYGGLGTSMNNYTNDASSLQLYDTSSVITTPKLDTFKSQFEVPKIPEINYGGIADGSVDVDRLAGTVSVDAGLVHKHKSNPVDFNATAESAISNSAATLSGAKAVANADKKLSKTPIGTIDGIAGATAGIAGGLAEAGGAKIQADAGIDYDNIDKNINTGKLKGGSSLSGAGKGVAMGASIGSVIPGVGTAIGAGVGAIIGAGAGFIKGGKDAEKLENERARLVKKRNISRLFDRQSELSNKSNKLMDMANSRYMQTAKKGGKFNIVKYNYSVKDNQPLKIYKTIAKFKKGGKVDDSTNIVPNGVSHEENNSLGTKGMPVVKCKKSSCKKVYEIESDELILTLKTSQEIEQLAKNKKVAKLGEFVKLQLLENTHSYTDTFKELN